VASRLYRERVYSRYVSAFKQPSPEPRLLAAQRHAPVYDYLLGHRVRTAPPKAVLELGCGSGHFLHWARLRGFDAVGIDASAEQVAAARDLGVVAEVALADEFLEDHPGRFDLIVALDLIEHLDRDEGFALLDSCFQALPPGGSLFLTTPNGSALRPGPVASGDLTHETIYNPDTIRLALTLAGFEAVEIREIAPPPTSWRSRIRRLLWEVIRLLGIAIDIVETGRASTSVYTRVMSVAARRPGGGR
jgi:2-polyprenyl-3-methyl-5-hydroxy-6-metoxy-1,4-benzoquinol methylase